MTSHRTMLDIQTDHLGNTTQHHREICAGCDQLRVITGYYLLGPTPDSWCPDLSLDILLSTQE